MRNRRANKRFKIGLDVEFRVLKGKKTILFGTGRTCNMSGRGILFTVKDYLPVGSRVELALTWPIADFNLSPLILVLLGTVVRTDDRGVAVRIARYHFRPKSLPVGRELSQSQKAVTEVA